MSEHRADSLIAWLAGEGERIARERQAIQTDWEGRFRHYPPECSPTDAILREHGRRLAHAHAIAALQPESSLPDAHQYRTADGVDIEGYYTWLRTLKETATAAVDYPGDHGIRGAVLGYTHICYALKEDEQNEIGIDLIRQTAHVDTNALEITPSWPTMEVDQ